MTNNRPSGAPFFLVGSDRSGTTMLRLMLNRHSRLHVPPETWFLTDLMDALPLDAPLTQRQVQHAYRIISEHKRWKEWSVEDCDLLTTLEKLDGPTLGQLVDSVYRLSSGKPRWGDKTPGYVREITRLKHLLPEARFVHLIRDGRDVTLSLLRTGWRGDVTWRIANHWSSSVGSGCDQGRSLPRDAYLEIAYEDLVTNTEETLRSICEFLAEDFEPPMLTFYEDTPEHIPSRAQVFHSKTHRPPRPSDLQRWRREMSTLQVLIFEAAASDTMRRVGQVPRFRIALVPARFVFRAIAWLAAVTLPVRRKLGIHFPKLRRRF